MRAALFDSSIYISGMRRGDDAILSLRRFSVDAPLWLSAVVLEELYAGASGRVRQSLERMERDFDRLKRILVPTLADWTQAGRVLARLAARYGYEKIGQGRLANDALIAMSAARMGATVITANERDFARLAEFRAFQWQVAILLSTSGENTNGLPSWFSGEETSAVHPIAQARALVPPQSLARLQGRSRHAWSESTLRSKNRMVVRSGMPIRVKFI